MHQYTSLTHWSTSPPNMNSYFAVKELHIPSSLSYFVFPFFGSGNQDDIFLIKRTKRGHFIFVTSLVTFQEKTQVFLRTEYKS